MALVVHILLEKHYEVFAKESEFYATLLKKIQTLCDDW